MSVRIQVVGLRELQKALKATSDATPKAIQTAHKAVAEIVVAAAQRNASSSLASRIKAVGTTRNAAVRFTGHRPRGTSRTTDALLQEFGGRAPLFGNREAWHTVKTPKGSGYIVYPAIRDTRDEVAERYLAAVDKAIKDHYRSELTIRQLGL